MKPLEAQFAYWLSRKTARTSVRRVAQLGAAVGSDIGLVRTENQDRAVLVQGWEANGRRFSVAVVADGIGGMKSGGMCASLAISAFISSICESANFRTSSSDWMMNAALRANDAVYNKYYGDGGTTLIATLIRHGDAPCWMSVGDSRIYLEVEQKLQKLSTDDTIAGQLGKDAIDNPEQGRLLQFIGMGPDIQPHVHELESTVSGRLILVTDGVHYLRKYSSCMDKVASIATDSGVCAKRLLDLASWCGGYDNATIVIIPLSVDKESISPPSVGFIEVFDSFGDGQFFIGGLLHSSGADSGENHVLLNCQLSNSVKCDTSAKQRGDAATKKTRSKNGAVKKSNAVKSNIADVPQLIMEFPNKRK
ncbi:PP2C family protein-serine/threonine phosphatase [Pseudomonas syringae]|uniref:PP2C family protein-serine/threonine phosphatase n=1 Tax=Pseudomonas syringae TaxID=317 RepID=UPI003F8440FC